MTHQREGFFESVRAFYNRGPYGSRTHRKRVEMEKQDFYTIGPPDRGTAHSRGAV